MPTELYKIIGLYLLILIVLVGISILALSIRRKRISFAITLKWLILTAVVSNLISAIIYKIFVKPGIYWGDLPVKYYLVPVITALFPIICVIVTLVWTVKKQLASRNEV